MAKKKTTTKRAALHSTMPRPKPVQVVPAIAATGFGGYRSKDETRASVIRTLALNLRGEEKHALRRLRLSLVSAKAMVNNHRVETNVDVVFYIGDNLVFDDENWHIELPFGVDNDDAPLIGHLGATMNTKQATSMSRLKAALMDNDCRVNRSIGEGQYRIVRTTEDAFLWILNQVTRASGGGEDERAGANGEVEGRSR